MVSDSHNEEHSVVPSVCPPLSVTLQELEHAFPSIVILLICRRSLMQMASLG